MVISSPQHDPLAQDLIPTSVTHAKEYRGGEVSTVVFEMPEAHLCYGLGPKGEVYDPCFISDNLLIHEEGPIPEEAVAKYREILLKMLAVDGA